MPGKHNIYAGVLIGLCACVLLAWWWEHQHRYADEFLFVVVDVGQGTGMYMRTPQGVEGVIDTGNNADFLRAINTYRPWHDRHIDWVIGSHADQDHVNMLPRILDDYSVGHLGLGPGARESGLFAAIQTRSGSTMPNILSAGRVIDFDSQTKIMVLHPQAEESGSANDDSVVLLVEHEGYRFLLPGDISKTIERKLVDTYGENLQSDVLVVSHHGSKTSSDLGFVQAVAPTYAVISAGAENRYGHPHSTVLDTLIYSGAEVLQTQNRGDVVFLFQDGALVVQ